MEDNVWLKLRLLSLFLLALTSILLTILIGFTGQFIHWLIFDVLVNRNQQTNRKLNVSKSKNNDEYYAVLIGSGFSGLGMAIKLKELGTDNFVIIERHGHIGGTWYANKYPGCACDVESNLYSFSFEPNPKWSYFFSRQPEIEQYLEHCTDKYDIRRHIKLNTTVTQLKWIEDRQLWQITTQSNDQENQIYARFVVPAFGPLSNAFYPTDIRGIDTFKGQMCHTAEWDDTIDFKNKRVAVVGTGASAIQTVPEIGKADVTELIVFQRTPGWVLPRADRTVTEWEKRLFTRFPIIQNFVRGTIYWMREAFALPFFYRLPLRFAYEQLMEYYLFKQVKDEELRNKVTPKFNLGCKRILITNEWYSTLQKPNVKLVTNRIKEVKSNSIVTHDGDEYPVDIIIWSTGFQVQKFSLPVYGVNGRSLAEQWSQSLQAHRGVTVPNFPNLFFLLGPNTALGHSSVVIMIEAQIQYIAEALLYMEKQNLQALDVKQNVHDRYNENIQSKLKKTVWQNGGCRSWYQDVKGNNTIIWPGFTWVYILLMKSFDFKNYILQ